MNEHIEENKNSHSTFASSENDSLLDFKSPKQLTNTKLTECSNSNVHKKKRISTKLKISGKNNKEAKKYKKHEEKKWNLQESQSIESRFFKSKSCWDDKDSTIDVKMALVCPLCFKTFKDVNSHTLHMKICAYKNNIPIKKLMDAIQLQKRQENERTSLGLLAAPILQDKKKLTSSRKTDSCEETDLQLALVLSKSLQEAEELDMINEIEGLPKISNQCMPENSESVAQLEKFGFANSKPASFTRNKKGRKNEITTLQTRSQEERNRILTERISEILVGNEPITQNQEELKYNYVHQKKTDLKSHVLQQLCDVEQKLWNKAKLSPRQNCFYVSNLSECISSEKKEEDKRIVVEFENTNKMDNVELDTYSNENVHAISSTELCFINENCESCQDRQFINTVITNWSVALNDSSTSDIIIFVNNDKHIWAHKLVFYVQCSNILLDVKTNDSLLFTNVKEKICWIDVSYNIALAFLEFIYCGIIKKYLSIVNNLTSFSLLRNLARKYKVKELFAFLQRKEIEIKKAESEVQNKLEKDPFSNETDNFDLSNNDIENLVCNRKSTLEKNEKLNQKQLKEFVESKLSNDACTEVLLKENINNLSEISVLRNSNVSPDLFDDIHDIIQSERMMNKTECADELIEKTEHNEDISTFDSVNKKSKFDNITACKSIDENINLSFNPLHFVTPKKGDHSNITKLKSNLSIFIEQIQKENRKSESDIEREISMLSTSPKLYRNPFHITEHNCSKVKANLIVEKTPKKDKNILNMFDGETNFKTSYERKEIDMSFNIEPLDNVAESSESSVEECKEKYKNNSMNKIITDTSEGYQDEAMHYEAKNLLEGITKSLSPRNKKIFDVDEELEDKTIQSDFENSLKGGTESLSLRNKSTAIIDETIHSTSKNTKVYNLQNEEENNIFSDFYSDEDEISIYSRYKRGHANNSIVKYRNFMQKYLLSNEVKDNMTYQESEEASSTDENSKFKARALSQQSSYNHSNDYVTNEDNCLFINIASPTSTQENSFEKQRINNVSKLRYTKSESNIDVQAIRKNSWTLTEPNTSKQHLVESPVLLSSSPELDYDTLNAYEREEDKMNKSVFLPKKFEDNISHIFEKEIYLANVQIDDINISPLAKAENVLDEHIVSAETTNNLITTNNCLKYNEKLLITEDNEQNCQRKSTLETSLSINTQCNENNTPKVYINSQYGCSYNKDFKVTILPEIIRDSVTPPPNYDNMKTPELHAELSKYGLKIQKRKRAIKLLTYIYNELHPIICATSKNVESELAIISSEDDEPPMKKFKCRKNHATCSNNYESQLALSQENINMQLPVNIIDEEKQFDGPEFKSTIDSVLNIKDMFLKLLTARKELHNKILAYQPVCINSLHSMLKTEGFKCKMNTLMNFLDEQCITFYVQDTKKKNDKPIFA